MKNYNFCNNCGKVGHLFHQCKMPITSIGIIAVRKISISKNDNTTPITSDIASDIANININDDGIACVNILGNDSGSNSDSDSDSNDNSLEYLLIRRKDSLGFVDFMRGKYQLNNKEYIISLINKMTLDEREKILNKEFNELWEYLWGENVGIQYRSEEKISLEKYNTLKSGVYNKSNYNLKSLIDECTEIYEEPEWGFPKGRRNYQEKDLMCALREFEEETGYSRNDLTIIQNLIPFEEIYTGSNFKSYKHKYFLAYIDSDVEPAKAFQKSEVSKIEWKTIDNINNTIRKYNLEKFKLIKQINHILLRYNQYS